MIALEWSLVDYANMLKAFENASLYSASYYVAFELMKRAAEELELLEFEVTAERMRLMAIISSLDTVVDIHHRGLSIYAQDDAAPREVAMHIQTRFLECAELSDQPIWKATCMAGLVRGGKLSVVASHFSSAFIENERRYLLFAAVSTGSWEILGDSMGSISRWEAVGVTLGIAYCGSVATFTETQRRALVTTDDIQVILERALLFGREAFVNEMLSVMLSDPIGPRRAQALEEIFEKACATGALGTVKRLIECGGRGLRGFCVVNSLNAAALYGHLVIVKSLVLEKDSPFKKYGSSSLLHGLLWRAANRNHLDFLRFFLIDWDDPRREQQRASVSSAFAGAASGGALQAMDFLLGKDNSGRDLASHFEISTVMLVKIEWHDRLDVLNYLVELEKTEPRLQSINWATDNNKLLRTACSKGHLHLLQFLLRTDERGDFVLSGIDPGASSNNALCSACRWGRLAIVKELLKTDAEGNLVYRTVQPGCENNLPLIRAACHGHLDVVQFLLQRGPKGCAYLFAGVDPTANDQQALREAASGGYATIVEFLLKRDVNGEYVHPGVVVPRGLLRRLVSKPTLETVVRILLQHPIVERAAEIQQALDHARRKKLCVMIQLLEDAMNSSV